MSGQVQFKLEGPLARVTLNHPGKFNAMSRAMWRELQTVFTHLQTCTEARCVIVAGADGHFCAGGDISEYPAFRFDEARLRAFHEDEVWGALAAMLACDVPLVAQIDGNCLGAGMEVAACCDVRVAGAAAKFGAPIARLGFPMAPREVQLLTQVLGAPIAREMLLEAAVLDAPTLLARGFVNQLVSDAEVATIALARARRICTLAPQAARLNKQTLRAIGQPQPSAALEALLAQAYRYADSAEHREGILAFVDKRKPVF
jgi:enoyl-CoA hydratase/carnithine racemase